MLKPSLLGSVTVRDSLRAEFDVVATGDGATPEIDDSRFGGCHDDRFRNLPGAVVVLVDEAVRRHDGPEGILAIIDNIVDK
jgi:hypothetical protein